MWGVIASEGGETDYLRNIDLAVASLERSADRATELVDGDVAHWAAQNLLQQRSIIARAIGGSSIVHVVSID